MSLTRQLILLQKCVHDMVITRFLLLAIQTQLQTARNVYLNVQDLATKHGKGTLLDDYDYVMHGKVFKFKDNATSIPNFLTQILLHSMNIQVPY